MSGMRRLGLSLALVICAVSVGGCRDVGAPEGDRAGAERVVDASLFSFLSKARATHHLADLSLEVGDRSAAIAELEQLVTGPRPASSPEVVEVLADSHARLADLRSQGGQFDAAERDIQKGLVLAREPTHFRGHLFEVRGLVEERRMQSLREAGDTAGAERARKLALEAFEAAIEVQDEVIRAALGAEPAEAP
jgi:tetratricopeptide (TPR) repeat protein